MRSYSLSFKKRSETRAGSAEHARRLEAKIVGGVCSAGWKHPGFLNFKTDAETSLLVVYVLNQRIFFMNKNQVFEISGW